MPNLNTTLTRNLELPPIGAEMLWGFIEYQVTAGESFETSLAYAESHNEAPLPQSIIVDTTNMTAGTLYITWDLGGLNYPISVVYGSKSTFTVPAKKGVTFNVLFSTDAAGTTVRLDLTNFPQIPSASVLPSAPSQSVTVNNTQSSPVPSQIITAGTPVAVSNALPSQLVLSGSLVSTSNALPSEIVIGGSAVSATNALPTTPAAVVGTTGNAWNNASVAAGGVSATIDTVGARQVSAYGSVSASTTITVNVSADGKTWFPSTNSASLSAAGNFYLNFTTGARYIQLTSSAAATITATVSAK